MNKRYKIGLVLGKLMPPTLGHVALIEYARDRCEKLVVLIAGDNQEEIPLDVRYNALVEYAFNSKNDGSSCLFDQNITYIKVKLDNKTPKYPNEAESIDSFYEDHWVPIVKKHTKRIGEIDVVFTSEDYGDEFARYLNVEHVLFDKDRKLVPISGTECRKNTIQNWNYLIPTIKNYFAKKIVIIGPESTGKSVLTNRLALEFNGDKVIEMGRYYYDTMDKNRFYTTFPMLLTHTLENRVTQNKLVFIDTDLITTKVYFDYDYDDCAKLIIDKAKELNMSDNQITDKVVSYVNMVNRYLNQAITNFVPDQYLLLTPDTEFINDGTRKLGDKRMDQFNKILSELDNYGRNYTLLEGSFEEKFQKAKEVISVDYGYL